VHLYLTHASLAHPSPCPKRHLDWFSRFLYSSRQKVPILYNGSPLPLKIVLVHGDLDRHLMHTCKSFLAVFYTAWITWEDITLSRQLGDDLSDTYIMLFKICRRFPWRRWVMTSDWIWQLSDLDKVTGWKAEQKVCVLEYIFDIFRLIFSVSIHWWWIVRRTQRLPVNCE